MQKTYSQIANNQYDTVKHSQHWEAIPKMAIPFLFCSLIWLQSVQQFLILVDHQKSVIEFLNQCHTHCTHELNNFENWEQFGITHIYNKYTQFSNYINIYSYFLIVSCYSSLSPSKRITSCCSFLSLYLQIVFYILLAWKIKLTCIQKLLPGWPFGLTVKALFEILTTHMLRPQPCSLFWLLA